LITLWFVGKKKKTLGKQKTMNKERQASMSTSPKSPCCQLRLEGRALVAPGHWIDAATVLIAEGRILWVGPQDEAPECDRYRPLVVQGEWLVPGFVDLHLHGAAGVDVGEATVEALRIVSSSHGAYGTTTICPTLVASTPELTLRFLETVKAVMAQGLGQLAGGGARLAGVHLEGPFLNPQRTGAQSRACLQAPDPVLLAELLAAGEGVIKIMTLAPELAGGLGLVEQLVEAGTIAAMGHSSASYAEACAAIDAGCRLATHTFNAMAPLHHREPGLLGAILNDPRITAELIADGVHVSPPIMRLLWRLKGPWGLALSTDCTAAFKAAAGCLPLGQQRIHLDEQGVPRLDDGTLAGSVLTMDRALRTILEATGAPFEQALLCATAVPAQLLSLPGKKGIAAGELADIVLLDERRRISAVFVGGQQLSPSGI
jgi:N-acetylglucosamine-6-phosphate deacetylase